MTTHPDHRVVGDYGERMAELARALRSQRSWSGALHYVVQASAQMIEGCDDVAISLARPDGTVETRVSLGTGLAEKADALQEALGEGPCLDTGWDHPLVIARDLPSDGHWPRWSAAAADQLGIRSLMCVQLFTHEEHQLGALQVFATRPAAFDDAAGAEALGIAAEAAVALGAASTLESMQFGLVRRAMISQATGMLMERFRLGPSQAFELLRRISQESGRKVYDLAVDMIDGKAPPGL